jgi:hypothetical protein
MGKIGMRYPAWAPFATEPTNALPTYGAGFIVAEAVKADLNVEYAEGQQYGDDRLVEDVKEFSSGTIGFETTHLSLPQMGQMYGADMTDDELGQGGDDTPPYGGFGYYQVLLRGNVKTFRAFYYPKLKASMGAESVQTKEKGITISNFPINFTIFQPIFGKWRYVKDFSTEAAAKAYLDTKLNVATWHQINVLVTGAGAGEAAAPTGITMAANATAFVLTITGTVTKLYDNGTDVTASIADGAYTIASVTAAHNIAVIF